MLFHLQPYIPLIILSLLVAQVAGEQTEVALVALEDCLPQQAQLFHH
jgi:hypothetical protein